MEWLDKYVILTPLVKSLTVPKLVSVLHIFNLPFWEQNVYYRDKSLHGIAYIALNGNIYFRNEYPYIFKCHHQTPMGCWFRSNWAQLVIANSQLKDDSTTG